MANTKKLPPVPVKRGRKKAEPQPRIEDSPYKIEKGIPITSMRTTYNGDKFPLEQMGIGDSFVIPAGDPLCKNPNTLHYAAKMYARMKPGFTLTTRMQLDKARRVWRIK